MQGRRALVRPEVVAAAVTQGVYAAAVLAFTTEYITDVVPLVGSWYGAYETGRFSIMTSSRVLLLTAIGLAGIAVPAWLPRGMAPACARVFAASTLGWVVVFVGQGKGWLYQLLPGEVSAAAVLAALGVSVWESARGWRIRRTWLLAAPIAAVGVVALAGARTSAVAGFAREVRGLFAAPAAPDWFVAMVGTIQQRAPGQPVYVMSTSVWPAFPLVNVARAPWPYHYHFLWPIPSLYAGPGGAAYRTPERQDAKERAFFDTVVGDLTRVPPKLLFVEHGAALQGMAGRPFDFVEYFSGSREFRTLFQRYRRLDDIGKWATYELQ